MLSSVVRRIWLAYVAKTCILTEDFARSAQRSVEVVLISTGGT